MCERLLTDRECWHRRMVVELLDEIAHPAALKALRGRLVDDRHEVRETARKAIERIEGGLE
ncbi:MAG: HEAT repeat domain-containing protein [Acidimicrobiales bacterium]